MPAGQRPSPRPPERSPAAGAEGATAAAGGDVCLRKAAPAGPVPADAPTRCRPSVGGRARPRAVPGALPAHTCPRGVGDSGGCPRKRSQAVGGGRHTRGPCGTYVDTCVAGVAIAWRGTAWPSGPRLDPLQRHWELNRPPSGALTPSSRAPFVCELGPLQPAGPKAPPRGAGAGGDGTGSKWPVPDSEPHSHRPSWGLGSSGVSLAEISSLGAWR